MAKEETKKLSKKVDSLVESVSKLSVLELSELVEALQNKLGVSAAVPIATAPVASASEDNDNQNQAVGGANQTLTMTASGDQKIAVIKALREINQNWGLKEAKDMTENLPTEILKDAKAEDVKDATEKLKAAGASVEAK